MHQDALSLMAASFNQFLVSLGCPVPASAYDWTVKAEAAL